MTPASLLVLLFYVGPCVGSASAGDDASLELLGVSIRMLKIFSGGE